MSSGIIIPTHVAQRLREEEEARLKIQAIEHRKHLIDDFVNSLKKDINPVVDRMEAAKIASICSRLHYKGKKMFGDFPDLSTREFAEILSIVLLGGPGQYSVKT